MSRLQNGFSVDDFLTGDDSLVDANRSAEQFRVVGGEMGEFVADFDWSSTSIGPSEGWTSSFRSLVRLILASRFPMFVWAGRDLLHVYNEAYRELLGDKHPGALGQPAAEVWAEVWDTLGPLTASVMHETASTFAEDLRLIMVRSGFEEETYFTFSYSPFVDEGQVAGVFAAVVETTDRVVSERRHGVQRAMSEALLPALTVDEVVAAAVATFDLHAEDVTEALIYELGSDGTASLRAATSNGTDARSALSGDATRMILGAPDSSTQLHRLVYRDRLDMSDDSELVSWPLFDSGGRDPFGILVVRPSVRRPLDDGFRSFLAVLASQVMSAVSVARAYEAERRRVDALAELDAAKTNFFQNVSHELRTPLTLVLEPVHAVLAGELADEHRAQLEIAERNGRRLQGLVDALLDTARIESGLMEAQFEPVDVGALTARVLSLFEGAFAAANLDLRVELDDVTEPVWLDATMWETIVSNLVANALKYCYDGLVTVSINRVNDMVMLRVTDTGIGISSAEIPKVFDRFHRVSGSGGRSAEGTGIGLAMVKALVEMHSGTVVVDSELAVGTTFSVLIPFNSRHVRPGAPAAVQLRSERRRSTLDRIVIESLGWVSAAEVDVPTEFDRGTGRVLVIDDNADMRTHLRNVLGRRFDVAVASDAEAGLMVIRQWHPDVVISDVMMTGVDGLELTRRIRADPELMHCELVLLSARAGSESADEGLRAGADDYLFKPFRADDLIRRVELRLERARERSSARLEQVRRDVITSVGACVGRADKIDSVVAAVVEALGPVGVISAVIAVPDRGNEFLRMHAADSLRGALADQYHLVSRAAPVPGARAVGAERILCFSDIEELAKEGYSQIADDLRTLGYGATVAIPLRNASGDPIGSLSLGWPDRIEFDKDDIATLERVGEAVGYAVMKATVVERERQLAESLQRELLRIESRSLLAAVAQRYVPADHDLLVGGDWFDVIDLANNRVAIAVGDVVGSGVPAAVAMSHLRTALSTALISGQTLHQLQDTLDAVALRSHGGSYTTVGCGILDGDGHLSYFMAGHPPPILVRCNGDATFLWGGRSWPLAASSAERTGGVDDIRLDPGDLLIFYTDGLVERRDTPLDDRLEELRVIGARTAHLPTPVVVDRLISELTGLGRHDDVVVLALRVVGTTPTTHTDVFPAQITRLSAARRALKNWLDALGIPETTVSDFVIALNEAIANAIEHGSSHEASCIVTVEAARDVDRLIVCVRDQGRWNRDSRMGASEDRGRGIQIMRALCSSVDFLRDDAGTTVTLVLDLPESTDALQTSSTDANR